MSETCHIRNRKFLIGCVCAICGSN